MKLYLTKGMLGERFKQIGDETDKVKKILEYMSFWKKDEENRKRFKIEPYDRIIFHENSLVVDFGDYANFFEIIDVNDDLKEQFKNV